MNLARDVSADTPPISSSSNPVLMVPGAAEALAALDAAIKRCGILTRTLDLVNLRASQINGCSEGVQTYSRALVDSGEAFERLWGVATWRDASSFTPSERAALALTEAVTRLSDRTAPIPDDVWDDAASHFDPVSLAALLLNIGHVNLWNRANACMPPSGPRPTAQ